MSSHIIDIKDKLHDACILEILSQSQYMPTPERLARRADAYEQDCAVYAFGCLDNDEINGIIILRNIEAASYEIVSIATSPLRRGEGIGSRLITHAVNQLKCAEICAETDDEAVGFYRKFGFSITSLGEKYPGTVRY
jgi:ribosomal protein S18 acetylase RimI-like enzyme